MEHPGKCSFVDQKGFVNVSLSYIKISNNKPKATANLCNVLVMCKNLLEIESFRSLFFQEFRKYSNDNEFLSNLDEECRSFAERNYLLEKKDSTIVLWDSLSVMSDVAITMKDRAYDAWESLWNKIGY